MDKCGRGDHRRTGGGETVFCGGGRWDSVEKEEDEIMAKSPGGKSRRSSMWKQPGVERELYMSIIELCGN